MVSGDGSRTLECLAIGILTRPSLEYHVTARDTANVKPPIIGLSHREAQLIVVRISATGNGDHALVALRQTRQIIFIKPLQILTLGSAR